MSGDQISRRMFIGSGAALAASVSGAAAEGDVTPRQTSGPFYPTKPQDDLDADLIRVAGRTQVAKGEVVIVEGVVSNPDGSPIDGALVDVWQANAAGRYDHEKDPNPAPLDSNFQGWAKVVTNAEGRYRFKTIKPGAYPATGTWTRPPHIHFTVSKTGFRPVTTQMYFAGEPLNDIDHLLLDMPAPERALLISSYDDLSGDADTRKLCRFNVTLAKV